MSALMLQHSHIRWKEWIPLVTQQQRLRNVIQIIGYNFGTEDSKCEKSEEIQYYYTLHLTTMCAPFYTSEKISKQHPKWSEINFMKFSSSYGSISGVVVRVWQQCKDADSVVTVWGVYFSGLSYIGSQVISEQVSTFSKNTLVFHMHGGYFTSSDCLLIDEPALARVAAMSLNHNDAHKSYTLSTLSRLHSTQRSIKELTEESTDLHNKILAGQFTDDRSQIRENSAFLRKLLNQSKFEKASHEEILAMKRKVEIKKFQVQLLQEQKSHRVANLKRFTEIRNNLRKSNEEEGKKLTQQYETLHKDIENMKKWKKSFLDNKETLSLAKSRLFYRQKQLISDLAYIYPIRAVSEKYTICNVHLPNSESFNGEDELPLSVALGFVADLVQQISSIINIPLRYPIIHFGSRSKIIDHITDRLPDKNREFPLFARSREKMQFDYAVFLLNKNIAQLRWYYGIKTSDLRMTLQNVETLLHLRSLHIATAGDDLSRISNISRNSMAHNSIPYRYNYRKNNKLTSSLDGGLEKWEQNKQDTSMGHPSSVPVSHDDGHSSASAENDCEHKEYFYLFHSTRSNALQKSTSNDDMINYQNYNK